LEHKFESASRRRDVGTRPEGPSFGEPQARRMVEARRAERVRPKAERRRAEARRAERRRAAGET